MPYPKPRKQIGWAFAAEKRGELPEGKAREWAHKSKIARAKERAFQRHRRKRGR